MNRKISTVASPSFQCRVAAHVTAHKHHIENRTNKKWLTPFFVLGLARAPKSSGGLDRTYTVVGKYRGKAATSLNEQFGKIAALTR